MSWILMSDEGNHLPHRRVWKAESMSLSGPKVHQEGRNLLTWNYTWSPSGITGEWRTFHSRESSMGDVGSFLGCEGSGSNGPTRTTCTTWEGLKRQSATNQSHQGQKTYLHTAMKHRDSDLFRPEDYEAEGTTTGARFTN